MSKSVVSLLVALAVATASGCGSRPPVVENQIAPGENISMGCADTDPHVPMGGELRLPVKLGMAASAEVAPDSGLTARVEASGKVVVVSAKGAKKMGTYNLAVKTAKGLADNVAVVVAAKR